MIENNQYMTDADLRAQLKEVSLMTREEPSRGDLQKYRKYIF